MPKRCCMEAPLSNQRQIKSDSLGELIFNFTRRELENPWPFFSLKAAQLREGELARQRVGWSFDVFRSSRYCHRLFSCAAKNLTSRHFSGCSLCFAGELNERPYPSPNLHFTQLSESKLLRMISIRLVDVYFCPHISWDELKELIFAPLSSSWCFRKVK